MDIIRKKTACFTGHRPEKFSEIASSGGSVLKIVKSMLFYQIQRAIDEGYENFISGMARGVDIWSANYVMELKGKYPKVKLICALPFNEHGNSFKGAELYEFNNILKNADEIITVSEHYFRGCYHKRNCFMVDNSTRLIAVVENYKSGTGQTISYAKKNGLEIKTIDVHDYMTNEDEETNS